MIARDAATIAGDRADTLTLARALLATFTLFIVLSFGAQAIEGFPVTRVYFLRQDYFVVLIAALFFAGAHFFSNHRPVSHSAPVLSEPHFAILGAAVFFIGLFGRAFVMENHALTRDEQMVVFDAAVFADGVLVGRIDQEWKSFIDALNVKFQQTFDDGGAWISAYLPVNAAFHALGAKIGMANAVNPFFAVIGLLASIRIAQILWPEDPTAPTITALFYATSTQLLAASMTHYAMTGHIALNMVWLWLVLRNTPFSHVAAIATAFLATGLHQIVFAPLFAAPFLALMLLQRRFRIAGLHIVGYGLIGVFWITYPSLIPALAGVTPTVDDVAYGSLLDRTLALFENRFFNELWISSANFLRFFTWQNLFLFPLLVFAARATIRTRDAMMTAMFASLALTPIAISILLPFQGHGWGYRYMHGLIGLSCLLGAAGWRELHRQHASAATIVLTGAGLSALVISPFLLWKANELVSPHAEAARALRSIDADIVVVRDFDVIYGEDAVFNAPHLENRPILVAATLLEADDVQSLCARGSITISPPEVFHSAQLFWNGKAGDQQFDHLDAIRKCPSYVEPSFRTVTR